MQKAKNEEYMANFTCPNCDTDNDVDVCDMPQNVTDDITYDCKRCNQTLVIGWHAEVEVRAVSMSQRI